MCVAARTLTVCPPIRPPGRAQIGDTTDDLNRLEGDLTIVQDSNSDASKELSVLEREARELNLTSEQMHRQLDILKNSNFLGRRNHLDLQTRNQHARRFLSDCFPFFFFLFSRCV